MKEGSILIVGTGAMACLFAARLSPLVEVTMLGSWKEGIQALRERGVRIMESDGSEHQFPVKVTDDPTECFGTLDTLVLVKSWQTARAADQLGRCLEGNGIALTLQNGMGNLEALREVLGEERAALGVTTTGATLVEPGLVRVGGMGPTHIVPCGRLERMVHWLRQVGFSIVESDDLDGLVWGKLVINAGINPLSALLRIPNGELLERKDAVWLMVAAAREVAAVSNAKGVKLPFDEPELEIANVAFRTARNRSSMYQDILRGAPTEIDAICGAVVDEGLKLGVPTPINETFWHLIRAVVSCYKEILR